MTRKAGRRVAVRIKTMARSTAKADPIARGADWQGATVATVNGDGTITTTTGIPARCMASYTAPTVGDRIHISRNGAGNWRAEGRMVSAAGDSIGQAVWAMKHTATARASTTNPTNDPELVVPVSANATYIVEAYILSSNQGSTHAGDLKCTITGPTGSTGRWNIIMPSTTASADPDMVRVVTNAPGATLAVGQPGTGIYGGVLTGNLITATASGTCAFQWAQQTSDSGTTTIEANSWMRLTRIA